MGASKFTEVQVFNGGLSLVLDKHLIQPTESRKLSGANIRRGILSPFLASLFIETTSDSYMYYFDAKFEFYPTFRSNVLFNRTWYWSDVLGTGKLYYDGTQRDLGIAPPIGQLVANSQASLTGLTGSINYVYTYYDPKSGSESPPSKPSNTLDLIGPDENRAPQLSGFTPSPDGYQTRLYRIGGLQTVYTAVETLPSTTQEYIDTRQYSEIEGMVLDTLRAFPPPTGLLNLTLHQGRFFGSVNAELYFTPPGKPDSWYALDFLAFDDIITAVVSVANGLLVMSKAKTWLVTGNSLMNFTTHTLSGSEGCISATSVAVKDGMAIWLSQNSFLTSNGGKIVNLSSYIVGKLSAIEPFGAVFVDGRYILSFGGTLLPSPELYPSEDLHPADIQTDGGVSLQKGAIVIDFSSGKPVFSTIADIVMGYISEAENEVYQMTNEGIIQKQLTTEDGQFNLVTESGASNIVANTTTTSALYKSFGGKALRNIVYHSPVYTEGAIGSLKQYEKLRVSYVGRGIITILDENGKVFITKELASDARVNEWVYIPVAFNRGYGIQFKIDGMITVTSLQWVWTLKEAQ